ncbi:MAG: hypothetical protein LBU75_16740 [Desulfovibrio sp.]|jgi:hypothetical protein|nr:hypothetical protein [Desulfovibrio sp.]
MSHTEADLPAVIHETEFVILADGTQVRYEESGGARDVFVNDEWTARSTLFPGSDYCLETGGCTYLLTATDDGLKVEKQ